MNGDRLTRDEFERRYLPMPEVKKAELIEGFGRGPDHLDGLFKREAVASGIGLGGGGLIEQMAQVQEMLLAGGTLGKLHAGPFGYKFCWRHGKLALSAWYGIHLKISAGKKKTGEI